MGPVCPSFEYLEMCSEASLESYELSRLNRAANLRKEMRQLIDEWIDCEVGARIARWMLESRRVDVREEGAALPQPDAAALPQQLVLSLPPLDATDGPAEQNDGSRLRPREDRPSLEANAAAAVEKSPAQDRERHGARVAEREDCAQSAAIPCAPPREPRLHDERNALRDLRIFVQQRPERLAARPRTPSRSRESSRPSRHRHQCAAKRNCGCHVLQRPNRSNASAPRSLPFAKQIGCSQHAR